MAIIKLHSTNDYNNLMASLPSDQLLVIDFTATWCGPCQRIHPILVALSEKYAELATVTSVDVDEVSELCQYFKVSSMPTFIFIKNNKILERVVGANPQKLEATIKTHTAL